MWAHPERSVGIGDTLLISILDEWGGTYWTYDAMGRETSRHDVRGRVVYYTCDAAGNRTALTDPRANNVCFGHDAAGRLTSEKDQIGNAATRQYDAAAAFRALVFLGVFY